MKRKFNFAVCVVLVLSLLSTSVCAQTMYTLDGSIIDVVVDDMAAFDELEYDDLEWLKLEFGWYPYPVTTVYALDGRSEVIPTADLDAWLAVGWYKVIMYAPDGRKIGVAESEIEAYQNAGWYLKPVAYVYAPDGRTELIYADEVDAYLKVGWYKLVTTVYAPDGRSEVIPYSDLSAWLAVGWYDHRVTTVYAPDGRSEVIPSADLNAWLAVGWYKTQYITMYDGCYKVDVLLTDQATWESFGWFPYPVRVIWNGRAGSDKLVPTSELDVWFTKGWEIYGSSDDFPLFSNAELIAMAKVYVKNNENYTPSMIEIDHINKTATTYANVGEFKNLLNEYLSGSIKKDPRDLVCIHLYDYIADHTATTDWYSVDRSGRGQNVLGEAIDLNDIFQKYF